MKKLFSMIVAGLLALNAGAVPANPQPVVTNQPDGSMVTLKLCGDEFYHFSTTLDGYTVVKNVAGAWVYAVRNADNNLVASNVLAHDADNRSAEEQSLLASTPRRLTNLTSVANSKQVRAAAQGPRFVRTFDISKFRGLVILIQPSDRTFSMGSNAQKFFNEILNKKNMERVSFGDYGYWTGSVRDYFYDNTDGIFDPAFDIFGPVTVSYKAQQFRNSGRSAFQEALSKMNSTIDYSLYDGDNNGVVDNVCFVVAGWGSNIQGNPEGLLWPHESTGIGNGTYDGKRIDRYSCSTELDGGYGGGYIDGIGTFCHEFTHVLGFPDLYDADYEENGQSHDPGNWDLMAAGCYLNNGRTPSGYGIFERYAMGFANPKRITAEGHYTLNALGESNEGYILTTSTNKDYFIMENRQKTSKWDSSLPGHGLIVIHVDSATYQSRWVTNKVNNYSDHNCYELLRAGNSSSGDWGHDPFPGPYGIPNITNTTIPNLKNWKKKDNAYSIFGISENNGVITFDVVKAENEKKIIETFNKIPITAQSPFEGQGDIAKWQLYQCSMEAVEGSDRAVALKNPSLVQMLDPIYYNIKQVTFNVNNTSGESAKLSLYYSTDAGKTWKTINTSTNATSLTVPKMSSYTSYWKASFTNNQGVMFRVLMNGGSKNVPCYIDNFTIYYDGEPGGGPAYETGDVNGDGKVDVEDVNAVINIILELKSESDYLGNADVTGDGKVDVEDVNAIINIILKV